MKISLENFKCHAECQYDLGEKGITLIKGNSGIGKSSILDAIHFAMYGKGMKVLKIGTKSCKVVLSTSNIEITRTKGPNHLIVKRGDIIYEDDAAQSVIYDLFTDNYDGTGYMKQNDTNSFILLSPTDKLQFIENYAFHGINIQTYKDYIKNIIRDREKIMNTISANLSMTADVLSEKEEPEAVDPPRIKDKKTISSKIKKCDDAIISIKKKIEKLHLKNTEWSALQTSIESKRDQIKSLEKNIKPVDDNIDSINHTLKEKQQLLSQLIQHKQYIVEHTQLQKDSERVEEMYKQAKDELTTKYESYDLWKPHSKADCIRLIDELKSYSIEKKMYDTYTKELNSLTHTSLDELDDEISSLSQKIADVEISNKVYKCPGCDKKLYISKGNLHDCSTKTVMNETDYKQSKKRLKELQKKREKASITNHRIDELTNKTNDFVEKDIPDISQFYETQKKLEHEMQQIKAKIDTDDILKSMRDDITIRTKKIENKRIDVDAAIDEESLREDIHSLSSKLRDIKRLTQEQESLRKQIDSCRSDITSKKQHFIKKFGEEENIDGLLKDNNEKLDSLTKKLSKYKDNQLQLERYNQYETDYHEYKTWCEKYDALQKDEIDMSNKVCSANMLRDCIADAQALSMQGVMSRIEDIVQDYLDLFFVDDPLAVKINAFKEDKKKKVKAQVNVSIDYKGMECTTGMLSGGELQRVMLAFNLAMSEIYNLPFILLDETMSNLDEDTTQTIVDGIKERCGDKLIVIIGHQVVSGVFDKIIDIC